MNQIGWVVLGVALGMLYENLIMRRILRTYKETSDMMIMSNRQLCESVEKAIYPLLEIEEIRLGLHPHQKS